MNRRFFLQQTLVTSAACTALGGLLLSLSSCKKEVNDLSFYSSIKDELKSRERKEEDLFSFFYNAKMAYPIQFTNSNRNQNSLIQAFKSAPFVITTNFNPFDSFFEKLEVITQNRGVKSHFIDLRHPSCPSYSFYIKKVDIKNEIKFPKKSLDFFIVNHQFINETFNKYTKNI